MSPSTAPSTSGWAEVERSGPCGRPGRAGIARRRSPPFPTRWSATSSSAAPCRRSGLTCGATWRQAWIRPSSPFPPSRTIPRGCGPSSPMPYAPSRRPPDPEDSFMLITAVRASWLRAPIPADRAHVTDSGKNDAFNMCLVEVETDTGLVGLGEAKAAVGNLGNYAAIVTLIREELAPPVIGRDPRDIAAIWELCYNGSRAHYAAREGRTFPTIGRRGITLSAISGID